MVVCCHGVLELMAAKSSCCNFPEQLSVCAKVITSRFRQNRRQIRDCLHADALGPQIWEQFMLTACQRLEIIYVTMWLTNKTGTRTRLRTNTRLYLQLSTFIFAVSCCYNLLLNFHVWSRGAYIGDRYTSTTNFLQNGRGCNFKWVRYFVHLKVI